MTRPLPGHNDPRFSEPVRARLKIVNEAAQRRVDAINARVGPEKLRAFEERVNGLIRSTEPVWIRLRGLYALLDEINGYLGDNVACRRGCSHCCHIPVALLEPEAQMLGMRLRRKPKNVASVARVFKTREYGYHTPCPFLLKGECSIYPDRPLACRALANADVDALLCELTAPPGPSVPYIDRRAIQEAYVRICNTLRAADIREYFPAVDR